MVLHQDVPGALADFWRDTRSRYEMLGGDRTRPVLAPSELFLTDEAFFLALKARPRLQIGREIAPDKAARELPQVAVERKANDPLQQLKHMLEGFDGRVLVLAESAGRRETMAEYFAEYGLKPAATADFASFVDSGERLALSVGPLSSGFVLPAAGVAIITETELYASTARARSRRDAGRKATAEGWLRDLRTARGRPGGAYQSRHRPIPRPGSTWTWAKATPNFCTSSTRAPTSSMSR